MAYTYTKDLKISGKKHIFKLFKETNLCLTSLEIEQITHINRSTVTARLSELLRTNKIKIVRYNVTGFRVYQINIEPNIFAFKKRSNFDLLVTTRPALSIYLYAILLS